MHGKSVKEWSRSNNSTGKFEKVKSGIPVSKENDINDNNEEGAKAENNEAIVDERGNGESEQSPIDEGITSSNSRPAAVVETTETNNPSEEFPLEGIATYSFYYLKFHDEDLQKQYDIHRISDLATSLAVIMLFGCGSVWMIHCPRPNEISLGGWYIAASLIFFIVYLLNLSIYVSVRLVKAYQLCYYNRLQVVENVTRRIVPIAGALTCGLLLLARCIENHVCTPDDFQFFNTYRCNPLAELNMFPAETALVCVIVPPFMQVVLKLDRTTTFICWLICWSCLISSTVVMGSYDVDFWFTMCGSSMPIVLYEVERQAIVNYRLLHLQQVLSDRANIFRVKARTAMNDVESKEVI